MLVEFFSTDFLKNDEIKLVLTGINEGDPEKNWVPAYHFSICDNHENKVGTCDLRIGYNDGLYYGGHIGYAVDAEHRGHNYAAKACRLLFLLAQKHDMNYLYITCNPDNHASKRTCEYLHGEYLGTIELPEENDMRLEDGETHKCIFRFNL